MSFLSKNRHQRQRFREKILSKKRHQNKKWKKLSKKRHRVKKKASKKRHRGCILNLFRKFYFNKFFFLTRCLFLTVFFTFCFCTFFLTKIFPEIFIFNAFFLTTIGNFVPKMPFFNVVPFFDKLPFLTIISKSSVKNRHRGCI